MEQQRRRGISGEPGFTLIELVVVVAIIGILAAIGSANFIRMQQNAKKAACTAHQRGVFEAAYAYQIDRVVADGNMNVDVLFANGFVAENICECPSSPVADHDDFIIAWQDNLPTDITCTVKGAQHEYEP